MESPYILILSISLNFITIAPILNNNKYNNECTVGCSPQTLNYNKKKIFQIKPIAIAVIQ